MSGMFVLWHRFILFSWCGPVENWSSLLIVGVHCYALDYLCGPDEDHLGLILKNFRKELSLSFL